MRLGKCAGVLDRDPPSSFSNPLKWDVEPLDPMNHGLTGAIERLRYLTGCEFSFVYHLRNIR